MPPAKVFWFIFAKVADAPGRTFDNRPGRIDIIPVHDSSEEIINFIGSRHSFLADITGDTSHLTVLAHGSAFIMAVAEHVNGRFQGCHADDIAWADGDAFAAAGTLGPTDDRQAICSHFNGVERAGPLTGTEPQAPPGTGLGPAGNPLCRRAIFQPEVTILELRLAVVALAKNHGNLTGCGRSLDPQNAGQLCHNVSATRRTLVQIHAAGHQGLGVTGTTGKTAGPAIGPGQDFQSGQLARVNLDGELFCGDPQRNGGDHADTSETQNCCEHNSTYDLDDANDADSAGCDATL